MPKPKIKKNESKVQSTDNFNLGHLKKVIKELAEAKKILEDNSHKSKKVGSNSGRVTLSPQMKREKFVKEVQSTALFKSLEQEFFKIIPKLGQEILTICSDAYNDKQLTNEQRDGLAKIGNKLASELPFRLLSGSIDLKQGFSEFVGALGTTFEFFKGNPSVAFNIGLKFLTALKPLENFIPTTKIAVEKSDVSPSIKEGFKERLDLIKAQTNKVSKTVQSSMTQPDLGSSIVDVTRLLISSPIVQELQKNLLTAIFPIGGTILNVGFSLYNSGILNDKQRNELGSIGMEMMNLPYQLLTGETDLNGVITGLTKGLKSLGNFFVSNPDIAVRAGATILPSLLPLGGFLKEALGFIAKSDLAQSAMGSVLKTGLGLLSNQFSDIENTLEKSALKTLKRDVGQK